MPKKSRQAHIPQQPKRRKARRAVPITLSETVVARSAALEEPVEAEPIAPAPITPLRPGRRVESLRAPATTQLGARVVPGQLPTFDRAYLVRELRQITLTFAGLLGVIIVLAIVLR
jgi:hypothetical protein